MSDANAVPPRAAVTVLLVRRSPLEVLMAQRGAVGAFPGALAFPGGVIEATDADDDWLEHVTVPVGLAVEEQARRVAAVRELWEETGLMLGGEADPVGVRRRGAARGGGMRPPGRPGGARHGGGLRPAERRGGAEHGGGLLDVLRASGGRIDLGLLRPLSRWVTPVGRPKRFDTWFYAAEAPDAGEAVADGVEIVGTEWVSPQEADVLHRTGRRLLMLPTRAHLARLAAVDGDVTRWSAEFVAAPSIVRAALHGTGPDARSTIPADAGYPIVE